MNRLDNARRGLPDCRRPCRVEPRDPFGGDQGSSRLRTRQARPRRRLASYVLRRVRPGPVPLRAAELGCRVGSKISEIAP